MKLLTIRAPNLVSFGLTWKDALDLDVEDAQNLLEDVIHNIEAVSKK